MNSQAGIGLTLMILRTVLSQPIVCIQPHQRFLISGYHDCPVTAALGTSLRVEDEPIPPKEQTPGGSRWIALNIN